MSDPDAAADEDDTAADEDDTTSDEDDTAANENNTAADENNTVHASGALVFICGALKFFRGALVFICGALKFFRGALVFICGALVFICGGLRSICGASGFIFATLLPGRGRQRPREVERQRSPRSMPREPPQAAKLAYSTSQRFRSFLRSVRGGDPLGVPPVMVLPGGGELFEELAPALDERVAVLPVGHHQRLQPRVRRPQDDGRSRHPAERVMDEPPDLPRDSSSGHTLDQARAVSCQPSAVSRQLSAVRQPGQLMANNQQPTAARDVR